MSKDMLDLNELPPFDKSTPMTSRTQRVLLMKDSKPICRTKSNHLPVNVSTVWSIEKFVPSQTIGLPEFPLYPDPENTHQKNEWVRFMNFLYVNRKAAVISEHSNFFVRAPDFPKKNIVGSEKCPDYSHAFVMYQVQGAREQIAGRHHYSPPDNVSEAADDNGIPGSGHIRNFQATSRRPDVQEAPSPSAHECVEDATKCCDLSPSKTDEHSVRRNFVSTHPSYLKTLSQTHAGWIFGAIAELVDNSRDANASRLDISIELFYSKKAGQKIPVFSVTDDGHGMSHAEVMRMVSFGHKLALQVDQDRIGRFGIGFKTGAMRLGSDAIVLTQSSNSRSVALLSQSFNADKDDLEIPVVSYCKCGQYMEVDLSIQSEATAEYNLNAIKEFSPFNEYFIGEKLGLFGESQTGTQIYIWNLDRWGSDYSLEWTSRNDTSNETGDILIRSRRLRSRPGQVGRVVPLDYSVQSYLEVMFLNPRMKIYVQGSLVKARPLAKSLNKTEVVSGKVLGKDIQMTLGRSEIEWERMNCGVFLYWHGRLIEAYKRVGGQIHNPDMGRGVLGVVDITNLMDADNGNVWVLNNKQGFQDCEAYAKLEEWLGNRADEYWDKNFDNIDLKRGNERYKPDHEWVQCNKCRKWRMLEKDFDSGSLPNEWFCYMPPFDGNCSIPEQQMGIGVITTGTKRTCFGDEETAKDSLAVIPHLKRKRLKNLSRVKDNQESDGPEYEVPLKQLRSLSRKPR